MFNRNRLIAAVALVATLAPAGGALAHHGEEHAKHAAPKAQEVHITITEVGFEPPSIAIRKGVPVVLVFKRTTDRTCARQAVFASLDTTLVLPLNESVRLLLPAQSKGRLSYACSMGMYKGEVVVK